MIENYYNILFQSDRCRWVQKIFTTGNKRPLTEEDVFPIDPRLQSERLTALLEQFVQFLTLRIGRNTYDAIMLHTQMLNFNTSKIRVRMRN